MTLYLSGTNNELMESKAICGEYSAPEVNVIEANCQNVICQSGEAPGFKEGWTFNF